MILPINWLKDFVKTEKTTEELSDIYHDLGFTPDEVADNYLDLEITPNRGDAISIFGLAREYNAYNSIKTGKYFRPEKPDKLMSDIVEFSDNAKEATPRFAYLIAHTDKLGESDDLIKKRLTQIGINPKNQIIDITNYLMHESGQPLHAFDLGKITGLRLDFATKGEQIEIIGGKKIIASKKNLVAYDNNRIVDLVGISGCENSSVDENTRSFLIQAAIFDPITIRRSSKSSGVQTPASYRYERSVDFELPLQVLSKLKKVLIDWGYRVEEMVDIINKPFTSNKIDFSRELVENISSIKVDDKIIENILDNLGFVLSNNNVTVPSWRTFDVKESIDIAEEVLRLVGYSKIPVSPLPETHEKHDNSGSVYEDWRANLQEIGLTEIISYPFVNDKELNALQVKDRDCTIVANPLSENYRFMRPCLKSKLVQTISTNPWYDQITLFEIGTIFHTDSENIHLGIISTSKNNCLSDLFGANEIEQILPDSPLGKYYKLKRNCYFAEAPIDKLKLPDKNKLAKLTDNKLQPISKFPPVVRDISFLIPEEVSVIGVAKELEGSNDSILIAEPFDEYNDPKFGSKKSVAIRITYQNLDHTLKAEEADALFANTQKYIETNYGATIRK